MSDRNYKKESSKKDKKVEKEEKVDEKKVDSKKGDKNKVDDKKVDSKKVDSKKVDKKDDNKPEKKEGDKVKVNKAEEAGIKLDVNSYKRWVNQYFELVKPKDGDKIKSSSLHFMLAAIDQVICSSLLNDASEKLSKQKNGLFDLSHDALKTKVENTDYFKYTFGRFMDKYTPGQNYLTQISDRSAKSLPKFIEENAFNGNKDTELNKDTLNLIAFVLSQTNCLMVDSAMKMAGIFKKKSVSARAIFAATQVHFTGKLLKDLENKLTKVLSVIEGVKVKKEEVTEEGDSGDDKKADKKGKKDDKKGKKDEKNVKKDEEDDDEEEEEAEEEEEDDEEADDDDDE